jgi:hypothetical protein
MMFRTANGMDLMLQGSAALSHPLFSLTTDSIMLFLHWPMAAIAAQSWSFDRGTTGMHIDRLCSKT